MCMQDGDTALIWASYVGNTSVVSLLLERGGEEQGLVKSMLTAQGQVRVGVNHHAVHMLWELRGVRGLCLCL